MSTILKAHTLISSEDLEDPAWSMNARLAKPQTSSALSKAFAFAPHSSPIPHLWNSGDTFLKLFQQHRVTGGEGLSVPNPCLKSRHISAGSTWQIPGGDTVWVSHIKTLSKIEPV